MRCQPTGQPPTYTNLRDSIKVVSSGLRLKPGSTCDSRSPNGDGPAGSSWCLSLISARISWRAFAISLSVRSCSRQNLSSAPILNA